MANNLFTLGLDITATQNRMSKQLKQIAKSLSDSNTVRVTGSLDTTKSQNLIQQQLNSISKNLKINVGIVNIDTSAIKQQQQAINQQLKSGINTAGIKVPFQFDLSDANAVKAEINKIVADITNNKGQLVKYKINVDDNGQATKALLTYRNELNEVTNATLKLQSVGKWYDANGVEHSIVKWSEGQKTLSQNIEATVKANQRQMESDNQVIRKKQELIAQMKLLNTQAEKAGISLSSDNQKSFNDLSINASTLDDIKQMESYLRLARTEYQTFNAEIAKGTHASSLETMKNTLATLPQEIALIEAKFNSIKMPDNVKIQIEELKASMESINNISDPQEKIAKYNDIVASLKNLQKQYQVTAQEQKVYPELTSEQRQYFGELAAGKRQITVFNAIVDEMSAVDKAIEQSKDSLGSATNENEIYRQSIEGLKNEFDNQFQMLSKEVVSSDWIKDLISAGTDFLEVLTNIVKQDDIVSGTIGIFTEALKTLASVLKSVTGNDGMAALIKAFMTYKTITKGIDIFSFFNTKKNSFTQTQNAMNAFFQSAINGTMQVKDGFVQIGEVQKNIFYRKSGFGKSI